MKLDTFVNAYVECALWSSTDNADETGGAPLDDNYGPDDIAASCLAEMREDCKGFLQLCHASGCLDEVATDPGRAGHDFWLTRNRHGAGFWDGDWTSGRALTDLAHTFGSCDLYVGDDGKVYAQ